MFSPLSWLYKESAFFIIKLRIWGIQILFVLDLRLRLNRVLKSQKSPEVRSSSSPIKILFPYSSAWIKYQLCILQICIMLIHELCPKGLKKSVQQTRSTFPLIVRTALNRPWNPGFAKKVGIFSFYLLRVSFSVRLNRIIILVERLMSLNGNLFSSLSFNRVWTIIPNPIHSFRIILFIFTQGFTDRKSPKPTSSDSPLSHGGIPARDCATNRIRIWCGYLWLANVRVRVRLQMYLRILCRVVHCSFVEIALDCRKVLKQNPIHLSAGLNNKIQLTNMVLNKYPQRTGGPDANNINKPVHMRSFTSKRK